tara:strand:+ start:1048 stop:1452 length:405 start_codon:yes stop_codon:yes gene_type:complete
MPLKQTVKRINPLDLNKNVKIGVAFPLNEDSMFTGTPTTREQVKTNLVNLLMTIQGERINEPNFGVGVQKYLFEANVNPLDLEDMVKQQVQIYIPEIDILKVTTSANVHTIFIKVIYRIILDGVTDSIQINLNN